MAGKNHPPEVIAVFGLFATVMCCGLEMLGVGVKGADPEKMPRTLGFVAIVFGGVTQLFTALFMYLFSVAGENSLYLGTIFAFFGFSGCWPAYFSSKVGTRR